MNWTVIVDNYAKKYLKRIPKNDASRIKVVLRELVINPYSGDIEKMSGKENSWRRRVGSYRVFYEIIVAKKLIYVFNIERRASGTY